MIWRKILCFRQNSIHANTLLLHFRKNIVGGTIEDSFHSGKKVVVEILLQVSDDRDTSATGTFVQKGNSTLLL